MKIYIQPGYFSLLTSIHQSICLVNLKKKRFMKTNMADIGMLFWQENIKIIENIFNVVFEKQEKNIANLISANLKTRMDEIKKTQDEMKKVESE